MADLEGSTLGRYELLHSIGRGGMADVYLANDPRFEREVAIKIFKREDEEMLRRFEREARVMASLQNSHLVPVYDSGSSLLDGGYIYYIVMPYMDGGTLRSRIRNSPISLKTACQYLREIADALDYMHQQGIIHRDIKSSNILLDTDGRCYLADFGIARASAESTQLTTAGSVLGTVDYLAPELFVSNSPADRYSDYYSLGVLLYEMVTGKLPFTAENQIAVVAMHVNKLPPSPLTYIPNLPPAVESVMLRALEKQPALRYGSAKELADAFCRAVTSGQTGIMPATRTQSPVLPTRGATQTQLAPPPSMRPQSTPPPVSNNNTIYPGQTGYARASESGLYFAQPPVYQPQQFYAPPPKPRSRTGLVTFLVLLALVVVISPIVYFLARGVAATGASSLAAAATAHVLATSQANAPAATQQAQNVVATTAAQSTASAQTTSATATQQAQNVAATAAAGATATAQNQASATPGVIQTAVASNPTYSDALNNKNDPNTQTAQWDQNTNCSFQNDGYRVRTNLIGALNGCRESALQFQNFAAQVDVTIKKGTSGGLFFRMNSNALGAYKGYLFEINANGQYRISLSKNFSTGNTTILRDWTDTSALKAGTKNTLQVIARNTTLLFYINGVFLDPAIQDQTFTTGSVAFLATSDNGDRANVVYSNLSIYPQS